MRLLGRGELAQIVDAEVFFDIGDFVIGIFLASGSPEQTGRLLDLLVAGIAS